tara:strand:+ start:401 stop:514 length:114 start_codon:yes stop_codon:yes gene_type:complete
MLYLELMELQIQVVELEVLDIYIQLHLVRYLQEVLVL